MPWDQGHKNVTIYFYSNLSFTHQPTPANRSCKDVQRGCPHCPSGLYVLKFAKPTEVYCDMVTDGGIKYYTNTRLSVSMLKQRHYNVRKLYRR